MVKVTWILVIAAAFLAGCTPTYQVYVNAFSELKQPLTRSTPIYIAADPNSQNPILRRQIASKIAVLLEGNGYNPVEDANEADFVLTFAVGINSDRILSYTPYYQPFGGYYGGFYGRRFGWGLGYTTYVPYIGTIYTPWLRMELHARKKVELKTGGREPDHRLDQETVWLGEALVGMDEPELRKAVNYLLVGCLEYLGLDTEEWVTVKIKANDPRIQGITAE